jgi:probable HAF family extracellular repeat protein
VKNNPMAATTAIILFAALATPARLNAQHTRYKLIDLRTLGGPQISTSEAQAQVINNRGIAVAIPAALPAQDTPDNDQPRFAVIDLGTLGGSFSIAVGINNKSLITGDANVLGDTASHGFLRKQGANIDLGTLGGINSRSQAVNQLGQVIGAAESFLEDDLSEGFCGFGTSSRCVPFVWQNDAMAPLATLGGSNGIAFAINNRGLIGGVAENSTLDPTCGGPEFQSEPVIWQGGNIRQLPTVVGDPDGFVQAINNKGQAVGGSGQCWAGPFFSLHAVLWQNGRATNLGSLGGALFTAPSAINDEGQVVGSSDIAGDTNFFAGPFSNSHGFLWQRRAITDLGTLPGDGGSFAQGINNHGQAVGIGSRAIIWRNGVATDLNTLVPAPPFSPLYLLQAYNINDQGEVVGFGVDANGEGHAFLAIPCDESHADDAACNSDGGMAATDAVQPSPATADAARANSARQTRFGRSLGPSYPRPFPSRLGTNPGLWPVR